MSFSNFDKKMMAKAIKLAKKGLYSTKPNPAVGCVICIDNKIVAQGWHKKAGEPHAEQLALKQAKQKNLSLVGASVFVSLEPCSHIGKTPACADALISAGIKKVIIAMQDPNPLVSGKGIKKLLDAGIEVKVGLLQNKAINLNKAFIYAMTNKLPLVRVKIAASIDGRTALANNVSKWITGAKARIAVHKMRAQYGAQHSAIITGIGTVLADNPSLDVRLTNKQLTKLNLTATTCNPTRVILDANLDIPLNAKIFSPTGKVIIMTSQQAFNTKQAVVQSLFSKNVEVIVIASDKEKLDLKAVLSYLAREQQIQDVMVEAGAILAGAFIQAGLIQEIHAFIAPVLMGNKAKPMFCLENLVTMDDKISFEYTSVKKIGQDLHLILNQKV